MASRWTSGAGTGPRAPPCAARWRPATRVAAAPAAHPGGVVHRPPPTPWSRAAPPAWTPPPCSASSTTRSSPTSSAGPSPEPQRHPPTSPTRRVAHLGARYPADPNPRPLTTRAGTGPAGDIAASARFSASACSRLLCTSGGEEGAQEGGRGEGAQEGGRGEGAQEGGRGERRPREKARAGNEWVTLGATRLWPAYGGEALVDIGQEVVRRLDAHRQPDERLGAPSPLTTGRAVPRPTPPRRSSSPGTISRDGRDDRVRVRGGPVDLEREQRAEAAGHLPPSPPPSVAARRRDSGPRVTRG